MVVAAVMLVALCLPFSLSAQITQTFTSNGTFTVPAGVTEITVQAWGGGGGAGNQNDRCGGGGGGAYAESTLSVIPGNNYIITVGQGGSLENPGGNSSFGTLVIAVGGSAGNNAVGGTGGDAANCTGTITYSGGNGGNGRNNGGGGGGGGSAYSTGDGGDGSDGGNNTGGDGGIGTGNGGRGGDEDGNPGSEAGYTPGGGGGGRGDDAGSSNNGADGLIIISYTPTTPYLSVSPTSIDFGFVASGSTDTQTFTLNGNNLDGTNVTITGSSNFQVSTDGSTFSNSVTISGYGTSISQDIYVQFAPTGIPANYNDNISNAGGGATTVNVNVTGTSIISYCDASSIDPSYEYISRVQVGSIDNSSGSNGYDDNTDQSTDMTISSGYPIIVTNGNPYATDECGIWVDWNADGDFEDSNETISVSGNPGFGPYTATITPPLGATVGSTRMRIRIIDSNYDPFFLAPCGDSDYGEVEDYTINVIQPVTITTAPISPLTYCPGSSVSVPYSISGSFNAGNVFTAQLSDENGSFASPTNIGSVTSQSSGTISATIPSSGIVDGNGYRIRVVSSNPVFTGTDNGSDISIGSLELITSPGSQCKYGSDVTISVSASSSLPGIFRWYSDAAGTNLLQESTSSETSSEYTATISSNQTYYVQIESGSCTSTLTPVMAYAIIPPTLNATAGGTFCVGGTVYLYSDGSGYDNIYWDGPNSFFSTDEDPVINNATTDMSGTYTVHTNSLSGVNIVTNGDFEAGNTDFSSSYSYVAPTTNALWPEGLYTIVDDPNAVHNNFASCGDHSSGSGNQMVINGATTAGVSIWSQTVNVVPNTYYQFTYWIQSVVGNNPSELQLYINGVNAGPIYTAEVTTCDWKQFLYNWDSNSATTATLSLVNQNTVAGGNDFALDDIVFQHTCTAEASVEVSVGSGFVPDVTITADPGETICDGDLISFTATPINGGTSPSYQWYQNGTPVTNEINSTFTPATIAHLDEIYCEMTSNLSCISGSATANSDVLTITVIEPPTAIAGGNLFSCGLSPVEITSGASATNYSSIEWTSTGSGVFSDAASLTACTYTPSAADITTGSVTITLTASGNSPCGDEVDTKTLTFTDPIDVKADYLFTDYCPQFLPPVSFNNDDDPRPPGRTELNFVLVPLNASANWQFELDFNIVATPGVSGTLSIDELAVIENGTEITATGGVYTADASTDTIFINALVVNQPGHSLDVIIDAINVTSAGCTENEEDNNTSTITIYPMPAIGKFE